MRSYTSPAGRLESHQKGFWIETLILCPGDLLSKSSNFFQEKVVGGQPPVNDRRVGGKHNTEKQADSGLGGWMLRKFQGEPLKPDHSLRFVRLPSARPCHGRDSSRWPPARFSFGPSAWNAHLLTVLILSYVCVNHSVLSNSATQRTVARQAPLCMEFSGQEYWSGLPFPPPGDLCNST